MGSPAMVMSNRGLQLPQIVAGRAIRITNENLSVST